MLKLLQFILHIRLFSYFTFKRRAFIGCFLLVLFLGINSNVWSNEQPEIVVNPGVTENAVSGNVLRSIFSMRLRTWTDGTKIRVFVLADDDQLHQIVAKEKLNVFPYQLRSTWDRLVFSGTGQAPIKVNSNEEMLAKVASTPGAIGYLWRANINESVNVLQIK